MRTTASMPSVNGPATIGVPVEQAFRALTRSFDTIDYGGVRSILLDGFAETVANQK
ncbi:hypothetical protein [Fodinicola feengrottensis]|uniref:Uncharacterized protein n=1 Tax=Fodinicola feengrottensis TaxID=435914 RepID=A0ABP4SB68_9ACTN|nr:hypothetical protein [Fodinicola feengrottensis]